MAPSNAMSSYVETLENSLGFRLEDAAKEWPRVFPIEKYDELKEALQRFYSSYSAPDYVSWFDQYEMVVIDSDFYRMGNVYSDRYLQQLGFDSPAGFPFEGNWKAETRKNTNALIEWSGGSEHYSPLKKEILNPLLFAHRVIIPDPVMQCLWYDPEIATFAEGTFLSDSSMLFGAILHIAKLKPLIEAEIVIVCFNPPGPFGVLSSETTAPGRIYQVPTNPIYEELHELGKRIFADNKTFFCVGEKWRTSRPYILADGRKIYAPHAPLNESTFELIACDAITNQLVMAHMFPGRTQSIQSRYHKQAFEDFAVTTTQVLAVYNKGGTYHGLKIDTPEPRLEATISECFLINVEKIADVDIVAIRRRSEYFHSFRNTLSECAREITSASRDSVLSANEMHRIYREHFDAFRLAAEKDDDRSALASVADFSKRLMLGFIVGYASAKGTGAEPYPALLAGGLGGLLTAYDFKRPTSKLSLSRLIQANAAAVLPRDA